MTGTPYDASFYDFQAGGSYRSARRIAPLALGWVAARSVLDVGCGVGAFLKAFAENGVADIQGVDGDHVPRDRLLIDPGRFLGRDLEEPLDLGRRFDLVVSLEVAEHLPEASADRFVGNLCRHADVVLFSAAIPEQGGTNHVNERWPSWWIPRFAAHGFEPFDVVRPAIWNDDDVEYWYRQNTILFANADGVAANPRLAAARGAGLLPGAPDVAHPVAFGFKAADAARVEMARAVIGLMERLCAEGGAYTFVADAEGRVTARRV